VLTYPAAVGREEWETPTGRTQVAEKVVDPKWYPPESIRAEQAGEGHELPAVVPAGPGNPLGKYALRLGWNKHLIHGTNAPDSIGRTASHGCIRLYPEDMAVLFRRVEVGTRVTLVDQPQKLGVLDGALYLESHAAQPGQRVMIVERIKQWAGAHGKAQIDWQKTQRTLDVAAGIPVRISETGDVTAAAEHP
jgi:L,D-transpeptidase ErfK/SrfK